ncbi:hypothetical protein [Modestobacter versicolor]|uniref:hypothetical protein n=1 Tax=Modestobacter versicolor TaxID=429133 RepID=UPI0034DFDEFF
MSLFLTFEVDAVEPFASFAPSGAELSILAWVRQHFSPIPVALVAYPATYDDGGLFATLWIDDPSGLRGFFSPQAYADFLNRERAGVPDEEPASVKEVNRSINDPFQRWTRSLLTKQLSFNDLDVVVTVGHTIAVVELKRSNQRLWAPYVDDVPNFALLRSLSRAVPDVFDVLIQYSELIETSVDVHHVLSFDWERIVGYAVQLVGPNGESVVDTVANYLRTPPPRAYTSTNRRHR